MARSHSEKNPSEQTPPQPRRLALSRRQLLGTLGALGVGTPIFQRALAAQVQRASRVTPEMIKQAEWIAGIELPEDVRSSTAQAVSGLLGDFEALRAVKLDNGVAPALVFSAGRGKWRQVDPIEARSGQQKRRCP